MKTGADGWIANSSSPTMVVLGLSLILSCWIIWPLGRLTLRRWLGVVRREFEKQFADIQHQRARQVFAWGFESAFREYNKDATKHTMRDLLDKVRFPNDFPPEPGVPIGEYADNMTWPNRESEIVWDFSKALVKDMLYGNSDMIKNQVFFKEFLEARRTVSKFWDDWAREIIESRLIYDSVKRPFEANMRAIRAITIAELAVITVHSWDLGPGKVSLYALAKKGPAIGRSAWFSRMRARVAAAIAPSEI